MIKIEFEINTKHGVFRDALHLPEDHSFSEQEIKLLQQERADKWVEHVDYVIANPPSPEETEAAQAQLMADLIEAGIIPPPEE